MRQLIFAVETNKKVKSDEVYIRSLLNDYYDLSRNNDVKVQFVYMDGKSKYDDNKVVREINKYIYENVDGENVIIYCFDTDRIDKDANEINNFHKASKYCRDNKYELIWFCKDIENVFIGKIVRKSEKKQESIRYSKKNRVYDKQFIARLSSKTQTEHKSNILLVLNKYLTKK